MSTEIYQNWPEPGLPPDGGRPTHKTVSGHQHIQRTMPIQLPRVLNHVRTSNSATSYGPKAWRIERPKLRHTFDNYCFLVCTDALHFLQVSNTVLSTRVQPCMAMRTYYHAYPLVRPTNDSVDFSYWLLLIALTFISFWLTFNNY